MADTEQREPVIPQQDAIEVYLANGGWIVIRQVTGVGEECIITLAPEHADTLAAAIVEIGRRALAV